MNGLTGQEVILNAQELKRSPGILNMKTCVTIVSSVSASLSVYAVSTRYPGEEEPVTKKEFMEARNLAEMVFKWVKDKLKQGKDMI